MTVKRGELYIFFYVYFKGSISDRRDRLGTYFAAMTYRTKLCFSNHF